LDSIMQGGQPPQPQVQDDLQKLGKVFGVDVSQFKNPDDARQALRILSERYIQQGNHQPQPQRQQAPPPPQRTDLPRHTVSTPPQRKAEDELDYNGVDPVVANRLRALEAEIAASKQESQQYRDQFEQAEQAKVLDARREIHSRANRALDSLHHATFGVGGNQTLQQQFARRSFLDMTEKMIIGMAENGTLNSPIEDIVLSMAFLTSGAAPQQQQPQQLPPQNPYFQQFVDPNSQFGTQPQYQQPYQPQFQVPPPQTQPAQLPYGPGQVAPSQFPPGFVPSYSYGQQPPQPAPQPAPQPRARDEAERFKQDAHFLAGARAILSRTR
jgi:hypothetical protein